eukprot:7633037-Pyramimonas_sp.AAC.1
MTAPDPGNLQPSSRSLGPSTEHAMRQEGEHLHGGGLPDGGHHLATRQRNEEEGPCASRRQESLPFGGHGLCGPVKRVLLSS